MDFFSFRKTLNEAALSEKVVVVKGKHVNKLEIGKGRGAAPDYQIILDREDLSKIKALKSTDDSNKVGYKFKDEQGNQVSVGYANGYLRFTVKGEGKSIRIERSSLFGAMNEAAVSKQQLKLFALALAYRKGEAPADEVSDTVKKMAKDVSMKELEKFAGTSHKGLPDKVDEKMDPTKHVSKDGDEYVVVDKNGEEVKRFKDKDTADKYAIDNHDALMES